MIKLIGMTAVIISVSLIGIFKSADLKKRADNLLEFEKVLRLMENEIVFARNPLNTALSNISDVTKAKDMLIYVKNDISTFGIRKAWINGVKMYYKKFRLTDEDANMLAVLANTLGQTDAKTQSDNIKYVIALINTQYTEAQTEYAKTGKMYRSLGILAGMFIAVLLI